LDNYASFLTFANIAYILQKEKISRRQIYAIERDFVSIIGVLPMDENLLADSLEQEVKDFEDMLQYQCAIRTNCDCIVTINTKHFSSFTIIPIFTPTEFLEQYTE
jgi:predicted nucleic acid-binding protein